MSAKHEAITMVVAEQRTVIERLDREITHPARDWDELLPGRPDLAAKLYRGGGDYEFTHIEEWSADTPLGRLFLCCSPYDKEQPWGAILDTERGECGSDDRVHPNLFGNGTTPAEAVEDLLAELVEVRQVMVDDIEKSAHVEDILRAVVS